jgi:hypothetical protein
MAFKTFYEIFEEVEKAKTKAEKIAALHKNSSPALKAVLGYTYDPTVKWLLPESDPPFKAMANSAEAEGRLISEVKKFYLFVEGTTEAQRNMKPSQRERIFIEMLESIDASDAKVLLGMKNRKLPFKSITRKLVAEAFPGISKHW